MPNTRVNRLPQAVAQREMLGNGKKSGWGYYSSGGDDEITLRENHSAYQRLWFKPRVMRNVRDVDFRTKILGFDSSFPVYMSAVAMCGLGHSDGEVAWVKAAAAEDVIFMAPTLASRSFDEITAAKTPIVTATLVSAPGFKPVACDKPR